MLLAYFDSSALVPLTIAEPSTARCTEVWERAHTVVSSALSYVEVHAALAHAQRIGRLTDEAHPRARLSFAARWQHIAAVRWDDTLLETAAALSASHALRAYDAVQCATALAAASDDFVAVSGDRELLRAWRQLGIAVVDTAV